MVCCSLGLLVGFRLVWYGLFWRCCFRLFGLLGLCFVVLVWVFVGCCSLIVVFMNQTICLLVFALLLFVFAGKRKSLAKGGVCYCNIDRCYYYYYCLISLLLVLLVSLFVDYSWDIFSLFDCLLFYCTPYLALSLMVPDYFLL